MSNLEVIARIKIRPGQLAGFKTQAAELLRLTRQKDTRTIRYDWFINEDAMEWKSMRAICVKKDSWSTICTS